MEPIVAARATSTAKGEQELLEAKVACLDSRRNSLSSFEENV